MLDNGTQLPAAAPCNGEYLRKIPDLIHSAAEGKVLQEGLYGPVHPKLRRDPAEFLRDHGLVSVKAPKLPEGGCEGIFHGVACTQEGAQKAYGLPEFKGQLPLSFSLKLPPPIQGIPKSPCRKQEQKGPHVPIEGIGQKSRQDPSGASQTEPFPEGQAVLPVISGGASGRCAEACPGRRGFRSFPDLFSPDPRKRAG